MEGVGSARGVVACHGRGVLRVPDFEPALLFPVGTLSGLYISRSLFCGWFFFFFAGWCCGDGTCVSSFVSSFDDVEVFFLSLSLHGVPFLSHKYFHRRCVVVRFCMWRRVRRDERDVDGGRERRSFVWGGSAPWFGDRNFQKKKNVPPYPRAQRRKLVPKSAIECSGKGPPLPPFSTASA